MSITCFLQDVLCSSLFSLLLVFVCLACYDWFIIMIFIWWLSCRYEIMIWLYWDINPIQIIPWVMSWPIEVDIPIEMTWPLLDTEVLSSPRVRHVKLGDKKGQIPWAKAWVRHSSEWVIMHADFVALHSSPRLLMIRFMYYVVHQFYEIMYRLQMCQVYLDRNHPQIYLIGSVQIDPYFIRI